MITSKLLLCCHGAVRDAQTNNVSVFNILEQVNGAGFPTFIPTLFIVAFVKREKDDPENCTATLEINLGETSLGAFPIDIAFGEKLKSRLITELQGLVIPQPGILSFELKIDNQKINAWEVRVESLQKPQLELKPELESKLA